MITLEMEAAARAIYDAEARGGQHARIMRWENRDDDVKADYYRMAGASILALRSSVADMSHIDGASVSAALVVIDHILGEYRHDD